MDRIFAGAGRGKRFVGVAAGAFGAHGLKARLTPDLLAVFDTAPATDDPRARAARRGLGDQPLARPRRGCQRLVLRRRTLIFSGSLYLLALTGVRARRDHAGRRRAIPPRLVAARACAWRGGAR